MVVRPRPLLGIRNGPGGGSLSEGANLQPQEIPDGTLYYMGIFEFDDQLVHFAQRETSTGERWQFEGEILHPLSTGRAASTIIDVEHDLKLRDELRVISGGTFTVHRGDRSTSTIDVTPMTDFWPGLAGYMEVGGYASGHWRGTDFIDGFTVERPISRSSGRSASCPRRCARCGWTGRSGTAWWRWCSWVPTRATATPAGDRSSAGQEAADQLPAALEAIVRERVPGAGNASIANWTPSPGGFSTETFLFDLVGLDDGGSLGLVFRRPPEYQILPDYDLRRQYLVMQRLAASPVPVPTVRWVDATADALGTQYLVMDRIDDVVGVSDVPPYHQAGLVPKPTTRAGRRCGTDAST